MNKREIIVERYPDEALLFADGFDDAIIGTTYDMHVSCYRLIYSTTKCIEILMTRDKMELEVATEFFEFNVNNAYVGRKIPVFIDDEMFI